MGWAILSGVHPVVVPLLLVGALLMALPGTSAGADAPVARLLADFGPGATDRGWRVVNDDVMGGRSQGALTLDGTALRFRGRTNTDGGGFSSIRTQALALDLSAFEGVELRVRGDGRRYTFRITTDATWRGRPISYWADFDTRAGAWTTAEVPFEDFRPRFRGRWLDGPRLDTSRVRGLGLMIYDGRDGPFELRLESIHAVRTPPPFSLTDHRWSRRILVLGATSADDADLERQLDAVRATASGFAERDMLLVVVLEDGASQAGERVLSAAEASGVRRALGLPQGTFSLRLVGKDGGVKRATDAFVPMGDMFAQIDAMPMRRAEMRERTER